MKSRNKRTNPLSDISHIIPAHSELYWQKLQQSRLFKSAQGTILEKKIPDKQRKKDIFEDLKDAVPVLIANSKPKILDEKALRALSDVRQKKKKIFFEVLSTEAKHFTNKFKGSFKISGKLNFSLQPQAQRSLVVFLVIAVLALSAFPALRALQRDFQARADVLGAANDAYEQLSSVQGYLLNSDFEGAGSVLSQAYSGFTQAASTFEQLSAAARLSPQVPEAEKLLFSAREAVLGLQYLNSALGQIASVKVSPQGFMGSSDESLPQLLENVEADFMSAEVYLRSAQDYVGGVDLEKLPEDIALKIQTTSALLGDLLRGTSLLREFEQLVAMFIQPEEKNYLLLFQNYRELRATGGFIGTVGLLRLREGMFEELKIESVYNPDGQLKEHIAPPGPLQRSLTDSWGLRDSNWFFNFSDSAGKAADFYEKEYGIHIDGVVALTPVMFIKLLELTGPVEVPGYGEILEADNFLDVVQYQTSEAYDRRLNQPKKFLADFAPIMLQRIQQLSADQRLSLVQIFLSSLRGKDIMVFSRDTQLQQRLAKASWSGDVRDTDADYLAVVNSNVGAGKTDQDITQEINLLVDILPSGQAVHTLRIKRTHNPGKEKEFPTNVDYLRVYVPKGSKLTSASGFDGQRYWPSEISGAETDPLLAEIDHTTLIDALSGTLISEESGKTVFGNWVILPPGEERDLELVYTTPLEYNPLDGEAETYRLLAQKQAGSPPTNFTLSVGLPEDSQLQWLLPDTEISEGRVNYHIDFSHDFGWGFIYN